jgi:RNA polymerase sigma-70 factor (ECF subfamily)
MTDQELLARIQARDGDALAGLYDRYGRLVYGLVLGMLKDTDEAEDLTQEIFVIVWNKASSWQSELGNPKNWLVRIAHNRAINVLRSKRIKAKLAEVQIPDENAAEGRSITAQLAEDSLWEGTVRKEENQFLAEALEILPPEQRSLIELAFFQGYSHSEIAEQTGIPLGTIKTRIRSALTALRGKLRFIQDVE